MKKISYFIIFCICVSFFSGCINKPAGSETSQSESSHIAAVTYPKEVVKSLDDLGTTDTSFASRARGSSYKANHGYDSSTIVVSPYYTLLVNGESIPVYATVAYVGADSDGALHSYAMIDVPSEDLPLDVQLLSADQQINNAIILPQSLQVTPEISEDQTSVKANITAYGTYTFMVNDSYSEVSQYTAFTLFVREYVDEEAEIQSYIELYGEDHVTVFEAGVHYIDYINFASDNSVIYICRGALLIPNHTIDINSDSDNESKTEKGADTSNGVGLTRYPVINAYGNSNIKIIGYGTIDFGQLDWHERRGIVLTFCDNVELSGITLVNCPEFNVLTYRCQDLNIHDVTVFGYRTNSDGIAICNSKNVTVSDCFARSGDDLFEVKTFGGDSESTSENITFTNCMAWNGKARCFGITGEVNHDISNVTFQHCAVIYRDATWDNDRIGSLAIVVEEGNGQINDITFEDIEIYHDDGRAINITVYGTSLNKSHIQNIRFQNITYASDKLSQLKSRENGANAIQVTFSNVTANNTLLTENNFKDYFLYDSQCTYQFE